METMIDEKQQSSFDYFSVPSGVYIRPYCPGNIENMGLEKHGLVLFPGCNYKIPMSTIIVGNREVAVNGLDENHPRVLSIQDEEKRKKEIFLIRREVSYAEYIISYNKVDPKDPDFWSKVTTVRPDNLSFWSDSRFVITLDNYERYLSLKDNIYDRLIYFAIRGGGYDHVGFGLDAARRNPEKYKWYLDLPVETARVLSSDIKALNKSIYILTELYETENKTALYLILKALSRKAFNIKQHLVLDELYTLAHRYLEGEDTDGRKSYAANEFIKMYQRSNFEKSVCALVNHLIINRKIAYRSKEGQYFSVDLNNYLGFNVDNVISYLTSDSGEPDLKRLVELYSEELDIPASYFQKRDDYDIKMADNKKKK